MKLPTALLFLCAGTLFAEPEDLTGMLEPVREKSSLPAIGAAVMNKDGLLAIGITGVRKAGSDVKVTLADKFHLGSCTKPMTATLAATFVEEGALDWNSTVGKTLASMPVPEAWQDVTLEQLLSHTGGFPTQAPASAWRDAWKNQGQMTAVEQRHAFVKDLLEEKPAYPPGTKAEYSNQGFAVAGHMMETLANKPWEDLMRERIFEPLGMDSAGFRAPDTKGDLAQPWGHNSKGEPAPPLPHGDNPDAIGPAGTAHASLPDWAKFVGFHLRQKPGVILKKESSFKRLHQKTPASGDFGTGGWVVLDRPNFGGHCIHMTGSNTSWFAIMWIFPERDLAVLAVTNSGSENAFATLDSIIGNLIESHLKD